MWRTVRLKFNAILSEGEYTADDLIAAVEFDVLTKEGEFI